MNNLDMALRKSIVTRPPGQRVMDALKSAVEDASNQIDLLESWDSVCKWRILSYSEMIDIAEFVDWDGHVSVVQVPAHWGAV